MRVLAVNAGSSSLKLSVLEGGETLAEHAEQRPPHDLDARWWARALAALPRTDAVGHRVVHGGTRFTAATPIDAATLAGIEELIPLAPLHQPASLRAIEVCRAELGKQPHVACFDTAFFAGLPAEASTYALPAAWRERFGVRRYGFHGLSHAHIARQVAGLGVAGPTGHPVRLVSCHLGSGASLAAIAGDRPLDTTMGFTPAEGLVMGTRPGRVDPGMAVYLLRSGIALDELDDGVERRSGLAGLAGSADLRTVLAAAEAREGGAVLARDVYLHRLAAEVATMATSLGGIDVLAFAGGVGEHSSAVRAATAQRLAFLGLALDDAANESVGPRGGTVSAAKSAVRIEVVPAREDLEIARQVEEVLAAPAAGAGAPVGERRAPC